jgi:hypothetical protein
MRSIFGKKAPEAPKVVVPLHPLIEVTSKILSLLASTETETATIKERMRSELLRSGARMAPGILAEMTHDDCERVCDIVNEINRDLCAKRGVIALGSDSAEADRPGFLRGNDGQREDNASTATVN